MSVPAERLREPLVCRPIYFKRPNGLVEKEFLDHVAKTGSPETFPGVSTTRPPAEGALKVIARFSANPKLRADGNLAPCPICSPHAPKFLAGVLIWCEATAAIYAIGIECAVRLWTDGRLDQELRAHDRATRQKASEETLLEQLLQVPALIRWVEEHRPAARVVDGLCREFRSRLPQVRRDLAAMAKAGSALTIYREGSEWEDLSETALETVGRMSGRGFLTQKNELEKQLALCLDRLQHLNFGATDDECLDAVCNMSAADQRKAIQYFRSVVQGLEKAQRRISDTVDFMSPENLKQIRKWGALLHQPVSAAGDGTRVRIDQGGHVFFARLDGLRVPDPLPTQAVD